MSIVKFATPSPIAYMDSDYNVSVNIRANGNINTVTDIDEAKHAAVTNTASAAMITAFSNLESKQIPATGLPSHMREIEKAISDGLRSMGVEAEVRLNSITLDDGSRQLLDKLRREQIMRTMSPSVNPAPAPVPSPSQAPYRPKFCPNCGASTGASGKFCSNCGSKLF